ALCGSALRPLRLKFFLYRKGPQRLVNFCVSPSRKVRVIMCGSPKRQVVHYARRRPFQRMNQQAITVRGARVNNLKNVDFDIPIERLTVVTGVSGSGKSSLAFDTVYAEGQRRYVESLSSYARQFLERMDKPDVDEVRSIPPAIA